jgi:hypothetical protein
MANNKGTLITSPIRPFSSGDTYATAYADEIKGGYHSVSGITERDAIPSFRRSEGMLCNVISENKVYKLVGGTGNTEWQEFTSGGDGSITVSDENNAETFTGITQLNFIGYNPTTNVRVLDGGSSIVDIWIEAPSFQPYFNSTNDQGSAVVSNESTTLRHISSPESEGTPFKIGSWSGSDIVNTIRSTDNLTYSTPSEFSIKDYSTTFNAIVYDADDATELVNYEINLSGNSISSESGITITVSNWAQDTIKYKANISVVFNMNTILPNGGRFSIKLQHNNGIDGTYTKEQGPIFRDTENQTVDITTNSTTLGEGDNVITKFISGVEYYTDDSEFAIEVSGINYLNERTYPQTEQLDLIGSELGLTAINNINENDFTNWSEIYNNTGASYSRTNWNITQDNLYVLSQTANAVARVYDYGLVESQNSNDLAVAIDTYQDNSDRNTELFRSEDFRLTSSLSSWGSLSATSLASADDGDGLQIYRDRLYYPTINYTNNYGPNASSQPNYSTLSGDRTYYRRFETDGSDVSGGILIFSDETFSESDIGTNLVIEISIDSGSTWWDAGVEQLNPGTVYSDGDACRINVSEYNLNGGTSGTGIEFNFGLNTFSKEIILRLTYKGTLAGNTSKYIGGLDIINW